jgi:hypothetical protein
MSSILVNVSFRIVTDPLERIFRKCSGQILLRSLRRLRRLGCLPPLDRLFVGEGLTWDGETTQSCRDKI